MRDRELGPIPQYHCPNCQYIRVSQRDVDALIASSPEVPWLVRQWHTHGVLHYVLLAMGMLVAGFLGAALYLRMTRGVSWAVPFVAESRLGLICVIAVSCFVIWFVVRAAGRLR